MSGIDILGLAVLGLFLGLLIFYLGFGMRWPAVFRPIRGYEVLGTSIERAVEAGERVHLSLGTGSIIGTNSAPAFAGLVMLKRIGRVTTLSDKPAVVTTGDGAMTILAQDSLRSIYASAGALDRFHPTSGRFLGPTPFSYFATLPTLLTTEDVSVNVLAGSFGAEGALAADAGERRQSFVLAGTDDVQSQALLYASASHPLIGEEIFAGGAYLNVGEAHRASLRVQDAVRIVVIGAILLGTLLRVIGVSW